jgi:predicted dehydrogenase
MLVGTGFGETHLDWLSEIPGASVTALCYQQNGDHARQLADRYRIPQVSPDPGAVLGSGDVDAMAVVTPPATHEPLIMAGLSAGLRVCTDKPLAADSQGARRLALAGASHPGRTMVTFQWRANPMLRRLRELCTQGQLGRPLLAEFEFHHDFLAGPGTRWPWRHDRGVAGAGALGDQGVHLFDLLQWLLPSQWTVTAGTVMLAWPNREWNGELVSCHTEDIANIQLADEGAGTVARVTVSRISAGFREVRVTIHGMTGTARCAISPEDGSGLLVTSGLDDGSPTVSEYGPYPMNPYRDFAAGRPGIADFADGYAAQLLMEEALDKSNWLSPPADLRDVASDQE